MVASLSLLASTKMKRKKSKNKQVVLTSQSMGGICSYTERRSKPVQQPDQS